MSAVRDFGRDHHSTFDDLHKLLDKEPVLRGQLPGLRARALACCDAEPSKNGVIRLVVADRAAWDVVAREREAVQKKLDAISAAVAKIDAIFDEMGHSGIRMRNQTSRCIWSVEQAPVTDSPKQDAQLVAWGERAEAALREAQAIVG